MKYESIIKKVLISLLWGKWKIIFNVSSMIWKLYMGKMYQNLAVFDLLCNCGFEDDLNFPFLYLPTISKFSIIIINYFYNWRKNV